jgi:hypothetical protein
MNTQDYLMIAVVLLGGIVVGIYARGVSDQKGWTMP